MVLRKPLYLDSLHQEFPSTDTPDVSLINYQAKSADYTVVVSDRNSLIDVTAGATNRTITLPSASAAGAGFEVTVNKADSGERTVTVVRAGSDTIEGGTSRILALRGSKTRLISDGVSNWSEFVYVPGSTGYSDELAQDAVGNSLTDSASIDLTYNDAANTITAAAIFGTTSGTVCQGNDSRLSDSRTPTAHTHPASDITDFSEAVDDRVGALLVAGSNVTLTYNDPSNTLTIAAASGGSTGYQTKSADYTILTSENNTIFAVSASAAARTITLPSATAAGAGFRVVIRKAIADTTLNTVTIARAGSDTIDGATSFPLYVPTESVTLVSDGGTNWLALDYYFPETRNPAFFGDANDGNATISTTQSLNISRVYGDLTITSTGILNCAGYILYVSGTLTINSGGIIQELGNNASGATAGAALSVAILGGASAGGSGGSGTPGNNGTGASGTTAGSGGAGGISGTGQGAGSGGNTTLSGERIIRAYPATALGFAINSGTFNVQPGGGGGGGGGGGASSVGGGGGGGARNIVIVANRIINNGTIRSQGGNGANGTGTNAGGGGSGGGGSIYITTRHFVGNTPTSLAGTPGTAVGSGVAGVSGGTGVVNIYRL